MDDIKFDQKTALEWIDTIEGPRASIRDQDIYPRLRKWIQEASVVNVLDIGSGQGICADKLDLRGRHYIGTDASAFLIERANRLYGGENKKFILGNMYSLPFPNEAFDGAFSIALWHLLHDLKKAAKELARILTDRGRFLIITAHPDHYSDWTAAYKESSLEGTRFEGISLLADGTTSADVLFLHSKADILFSLEEAALEVTFIETIRGFMVLEGLRHARFAPYANNRHALPEF